ncbi:hypothetical protein Tco_1360830 [Tanacetum coccineum]
MDSDEFAISLLNGIGMDFVMSDSEDSTITYTEAPPSPNYVPGPEEPEHAPPPPEFVPEPVYPEFMPIEDDVLLVEEQPLPTVVSPTADSLGYITEFDPEEDLEEDDEDPEEDPTDYPTDRDEDGRRSPPETMLMMKRRTRMRRKRST